MAEFSQELFDTICERIAEGESLNAICFEEDMPSRKSFYAWMKSDEDLGNKYARATEVRADHLFDEMLMIADTPVEGEKAKIDKDGNVETRRGDMIEHRRLQVDTRKWVLARMQPRKYGDKLAIGGDKSMDAIQTERVSGAAKLASFIGNIAERRGTTGKPSAE